MNKYEKVKELVAGGMKISAALKATKLSNGSYYYYKKLEANSLEPKTQVVSYDATPAKRAYRKQKTQPKTQFALLIGTPEQVAAFYRGLYE